MLRNLVVSLYETFFIRNKVRFLNQPQKAGKDYSSMIEFPSRHLSAKKGLERRLMTLWLNFTKKPENRRIDYNEFYFRRRR